MTFVCSLFFSRAVLFCFGLSFFIKHQLLSFLDATYRFQTWGNMLVAPDFTSMKRYRNRPYHCPTNCRLISRCQSFLERPIKCWPKVPWTANHLSPPKYPWRWRRAPVTVALAPGRLAFSLTVIVVTKHRPCRLRPRPRGRPPRQEIGALYP